MKKWFENDYFIRLWLSSILFTIIGGVMFVLAGEIDDSIWINILNSMGSVLIVSGVYNVVYEYILKSKLISLIIQKVKLKNSINKSGIIDVMLRSDDVPYKELIKEATSTIVVVHAYGSTWTRNYIEIIKEVGLQKKLNITVALLSVNSKFCDSIDIHYKKSVGNMVDSIKRTTKYWENMGEKLKGNSVVKVYYFEGNPVHSLYKFDDKIVVVSNKISNTLSLNLPSFICEQNKETKQGLYQIYEEEIEELISNGELVYSNQEKKNEREKDL